ncbi:MAG: TlpA family protein disulfide reductase [Bacteroidota bacterium]
MRRKIIPLMLMLAAGLMVWQCSPKEDPAEVQTGGEPETLLEPITASQIDSVVKQYRGEKAVLVNLWATWCGPCVEEFPHIVELQEKYEDQLKVIFISGDFTDPYVEVPKFLKEYKVDWTTYLKTGNDQEFIPAVDPTWSGALPFTKIYDKQGNVVARWENSADFETFHKHVKNAINGG